MKCLDDLGCGPPRLDPWFISFISHRSPKWMASWEDWNIFQYGSPMVMKENGGHMKTGLSEPMVIFMGFGRI